MEIFKGAIDGNELNDILQKDRLSLEDRFKMDSCTCYTLVEKLGDLKNEELNEVYYLEAKNIYKVINVASMYLEIYGKETFEKIFDLPIVQQIIREVYDESNNPELRKERLFYLMIIRKESYCKFSI